MKHLIALGQLLRDVGPVDGRKKLQKIVHILQEGGVDFSVSYEYSNFGPYSIELKGGMDELVTASLVSESPLSSGKGYRYAITAGFLKILEKLEVGSPRWAVIAKEMNAMEAKDLEGISTILFLRAKGWSGEELEERFHALKQHLAENFDVYHESGKKLVDRISPLAA